MSTATISQPANKTKAPSKNPQPQPADHAAIGPAAGKHQPIPIKLLKPSPFNPRKSFDAKELDSLADSLKKHGQLQACVVRRVGADYEIIAGERRWRAAKLANMVSVDCRVIEATDAEAVELAGIENLQRKDLNPIEEAQWYKAMLEKAAYTQQTLAERLEITQGQVSNRLRLLELPTPIKDKIISGEIPVTWARHLAAWTHRPAVMELVAKAVQKEIPDSENGFQDEIDEAIDSLTRPTKGYFQFHAGNKWRSGEVSFSASKEQKEQLQTEMYETRHCAREERCWNIQLWEKLQEEGLKKSAERQSSKAEKSIAAAKTPAEVQATQKKMAKQFAKRLYFWKIAWLQTLITPRIEKISDALLLRLLIHFATLGGEHYKRSKDFRDVLRSAGGKVKGDEWNLDVLASVVDLSDAKMRGLAIELVKRWLSTRGSYGPLDIDNDEIELLVEVLHIDIKKEWVLTEEYLQLHTSGQLRELVDELGIAASPKELQQCKRDELIALFTDQKPKECPAEVLSARRPK